MKRIIWWAISAACTILIVEMVLRVVSPMHLTGGNIGIYKYDPIIGYTLKKGYWSQLTDFKQETFVNNIGTVNISNDFKPYKSLVFALGDSNTQGTGVPMDQPYPMQLDLLLNLHMGEYQNEYGIVNLGLAANGGKQNLLLYSKYKKILGVPNYIMYLGTDNDVGDDMLFESGHRHRHLVEGSPIYGNWVKPLAWLIHRTEIGKRMNYIRGQYKLNEIKNNELGKIEDPSNKSVAQQQEHHLNWLKKEADSINAKLIVGWSDLPPESLSYEWLKEWATRNDIAFADWYQSVSSVKSKLPMIQIKNDHMSGHYRSWVLGQIAQSFRIHIQNTDGNR